MSATLDALLSDDDCRSILERLTQPQREVVALVMEGFNLTEAAAMLGITPGAARDRMYQARLRLGQVKPPRFSL